MEMTIDLAAPGDPDATRSSLLFRVRDWRDSSSWEEFHRLYRKLVVSLSLRAGLTYAEAEDVAQDVFTRVAETIHTFESDAARGSFRGWLMNLTRWRITDQYRRKNRHPVAHAAQRDREDHDGTDTVERIPDEHTLMRLDGEIDEWRRHVVEAALARLARRVPAKHFQAFELYTRQNWPVAKVAHELHLNIATVYVLGHRLTKQLRAEVKKLEMHLA